MATKYSNDPQTGPSSREGPGTLYIVSTPIGNLGDISLRALEVLRDADLIACEDTRNTRKLLSRYDIHTPMTSFHEHSRYEKALEIAERLSRGEDVALVTDAGTPLISDPGGELSGVCINRGIHITAVPGPAAAVNALVLSGMSAERFVFEGFLPRRKKERAEALGRIQDEPGTIIIYEAPHRLRETLTDLADTLGSGRRIALCREMTKVHEEVLRGTIGELIDTEPRGEYVLVIEGRPEAERLLEQAEAYAALPLREHMEMYLGRGLSEKEAIRQVALDRGVPKREIYNQIKR